MTYRYRQSYHIARKKLQYLRDFFLAFTLSHGGENVVNPLE